MAETGIRSLYRLSQEVQFILDGGGTMNWSVPVDANIVPDTNATYNLGSSSLSFLISSGGCSLGFHGSEGSLVPSTPSKPYVNSS